MYRVFDKTTQDYVKVGRGVWLRKCDVIASLSYNGYIYKVNGKWEWRVVEKYDYGSRQTLKRDLEIYKFTDTGRVIEPLNTIKAPKVFQVPVYDDSDATTEKHKYLNRYNWFYRGESNTQVDNHEWNDTLIVDTYWNGASSSYIELHSANTGRTYYTQLRDFMKMLPYLVNNTIFGTFTFVRYSTVYAIKLVESEK